jgi:antitoxin FitA
MQFRGASNRKPSLHVERPLSSFLSCFRFEDKNKVKTPWQSLQSLLKLPALMASVPVASITIRNLDEPLKARLRIQAAMHGRSMEDEARDILRTALNQQPVPPANLAAAIRARFAPLGGVELPEVPREPMRDPPELGE